MTTIDPLLKVHQAAKMLGISVPTFWRLASAGKVPKPIKLGGSSRWVQSELLEIIEAAKSART